MAGTTTNVLHKSCSADERRIIFISVPFLFCGHKQHVVQWEMNRESVGWYAAGEKITIQKGSDTVFIDGESPQGKWLQVSSLDAADPPCTDSLASHQSRRPYLASSLDAVRHEPWNFLCINRANGTMCSYLTFNLVGICCPVYEILVLEVSWQNQLRVIIYKIASLSDNYWKYAYWQVVFPGATVLYLRSVYQQVSLRVPCGHLHWWRAHSERWVVLQVVGGGVHWLQIREDLPQRPQICSVWSWQLCLCWPL